VFEAQCRCGAIGLKIAGKPIVQLYCHCDDSQAAHAAAYVPAAIYPAAAAAEVSRGKPKRDAAIDGRRRRALRRGAGQTGRFLAGVGETPCLACRRPMLAGQRGAGLTRKHTT